MIRGITATIFVSDMDRAIDFYTETLGLPLSVRYGNEYASIETGTGISIELHPAAKRQETDRGANAIQIGLSIDEPIEQVMKRLLSRGIVFSSGPQINAHVRLAHFRDPDGNELYLAETRPAERRA